MLIPEPVGGALWLLDGNNLIQRYHHKIPTQTNADGAPVQGVRGLGRLVQRIHAQHGPQAIAVAFDAGDTAYSGRRDLLPAYKAGLPPTPPEVSAQIELAHRWLPDPRYGASTVRCPGFEADDVLVTLALSGRAAGHSVYLVTSDKDMHAQVSDDAPPIAVYNRRTGAAAQGWRLYREADVLERFGVRPNRILDWLALTGDDVDGVPGVPGVGPAIAADLLRVYGDLPTLLGAIGSIKREAVKLALRACAAQVRLARQVLEPVPVPPATLIENFCHARTAAAPLHP